VGFEVLPGPVERGAVVADQLFEVGVTGRWRNARTCRGFDASALAHVITEGASINAKHVGTIGMHRNDSDTLWTDGKATRRE
jgi:hypothetical protein